MADQEQQEQPVYDRWSRPQALSNRGYVLVVVVVVLVAAAAFGAVALVSAGDETGTGTTVRLPVTGESAGSGAGTTPIEGILRVDQDHCVYLEPPGGGTDRTWVVWPSGYHAVLDQNRLSLYDGGNTVVAVDGDLVRATGSTAPAGSFTSEPCLPDRGDVRVVESEITVVQ